MINQNIENNNVNDTRTNVSRSYYVPSLSRMGSEVNVLILVWEEKVLSNCKQNWDWSETSNKIKIKSVYDLERKIYIVRQQDQKWNIV